jgi:lipoyl(octanoyl) transferase
MTQFTDGCLTTRKLWLCILESHTLNMRKLAALLNYGQIDYEEAWSFQQRIVEDRLAERRPDTLLLLEHPPVYTIGRSGRAEHWGDDVRLRATGIPVYHVERGGSVTYHGPGQLVGYPILSLARHCAGPKAYMRLLEELLIRTLGDFGLAAGRRDKLTGVWLMDGVCQKIAAMGVRVVRGVTMHGFALNVTTDLEPFRHILPCGLTDCQMTSMAEHAQTGADLHRVRQRLAYHFAELFELQWSEAQPVTSPPAERLPLASVPV